MCLYTHLHVAANCHDAHLNNMQSARACSTADTYLHSFIHLLCQVCAEWSDGFLRQPMLQNKALCNVMSSVKIGLMNADRRLPPVSQVNFGDEDNRVILCCQCL